MCVCVFASPSPSLEAFVAGGLLCVGGRDICVYPCVYLCFYDFIFSQGQQNGQAAISPALLWFLRALMLRYSYILFDQNKGVSI